METNYWPNRNIAQFHQRSTNNFCSSRAQFHQCSTYSFHTRGAQKCKKGSQVVSLFTLLGSANEKAACTYVGEIDPRSQSAKKTNN